MAAPSKIAKNELALVTQEDILRDYLITQNPAMGSEVEHIVTNDRSQLITVKDHDRLKDALHRAGVPVTDEPLASIFEVKTKAHKSAAPLIAEMSRLHQKFSAAIRDQGYRPAQIGYLGNLTLKQAMESPHPLRTRRRLAGAFYPERSGDVRPATLDDNIRPFEHFLR